MCAGALWENGRGCRSDEEEEEDEEDGEGDEEEEEVEANNACALRENNHIPGPRVTVRGFYVPRDYRSGSDGCVPLLSVILLSLPLCKLSCHA